MGDDLSFCFQQLAAKVMAGSSETREYLSCGGRKLTNGQSEALLTVRQMKMTGYLSGKFLGKPEWLKKKSGNARMRYRLFLTRSECQV